jgi:hypothetical protein
MPGRGVALQVPGAEDPVAAALDQTAPRLPGLAGVVEANQGVRLGEADLQTGEAAQGAQGPGGLQLPGSGPVLGGEVLVLHLPRMVECVEARVSDEKR